MNWNKPFTTRNGLKARRILVLSGRGENEDRNIVIITLPEGKELTRHIYDNGKYLGGNTVSDYDLINVPEVVEVQEVFVNVYEPSPGAKARAGGGAYQSAAAAKQAYDLTPECISTPLGRYLGVGKMKTTVELI